MRVGARVKVTVAVLAAVTLAPTQSGSQDVPGTPAQVVDFEPPTRVERFPYTDFGRSPSARDDRRGTATFRVVERTGNCCENYITITPQGRLLDLGGRYVNFSDNEGRTWKQVKPLNPLVNGEGAIAVAPGGDIVGVEWDAYTADHLISYKYDAKTKEWQSFEMPLKTPFYDRPWITVVPGPISIEGQKVPYVTIVDGYPHLGLYLISTDGLTYRTVSAPALDRGSAEGVKAWLKTARRAEMDWIQPNSQSPAVPLGTGTALAPEDPLSDGWSIFHAETLSWEAFELPKGGLTGRVLVDSRGRIHNLIDSSTMFEYRISANGGRSWKSLSVMLPAGHQAAGDDMQTDFRVNADAGTAAVAMHTNKANNDGDLVYTIDISSNKPRLDRLYDLGKGDVNASSGVGQNIRFDFETVALFPDGRIAVSFLDSTTGPVYHLAEPATERLGPALAIELP